MKISREVLLKKLEAVSPGLAKKEIIDQSQCFVFQDGKIITFNDEIACSVESPLKIEGPVPAEPLLNLLRRLKEDDLEITQKDGELIIKGKGRRAGISMEAEILLQVEGLEQPEKWKKLPEDFIEAIGIVGTCASSDESQFIITCVHIHPKWVEAMDNDQAIRFPIKTGLKESILARWSSLKHIHGLDMTEMAHTDSWLHFRNPAGLVLSCRRNEEQYPDLSGILGAKGTKITLPKGLEEAVVKAEVFAKDEIGDSFVTVNLTKGRLTLEGRGASGWYQERKKISYSGEPLKFMVSPVLLVELSKRANECMVCENCVKIDTGKFTYISSIFGEDGE